MRAKSIRALWDQSLVTMGEFYVNAVPDIFLLLGVLGVVGFW